MKFKVGDRVKCINDGGCGKNLSGKYGTIKVKHDDSPYGVEFDKYICGHTCDGYAKNGHGWNCEESMLELADEKTNSILIYRDGLKVIAEDDNTGKTGIAKCKPQDEFDFYTGAKLALERLMGEEKKKVKFTDGMGIWCENKSQFDELMNILEANGYKWYSSTAPTKFTPPCINNGVTIYIVDEKYITYRNHRTVLQIRPNVYSILIDFSDVDFSECVPKIKVGDYVRVTDLGASYSLYDSFFKAYPDIPVDVAARYMWGIEPEKDKPHKVLYIKKHPRFGNDVCVIEKSLGGVYIVGVEGIEKC